MIDSGRLRSRMSERDLSQGALARRVGISQQSISKLVSGRSYNSRQLHKVARELGTTPAYLTGETDDPESDFPDEPPLNRDERALVDLFGQLPPDARAALLTVARAMADKERSTVHSPKPDYRADPGRE